MNRQKKKQKKAKKRQQDNKAKTRQTRERRKYKDAFPDIVLRNANKARPEFVKAVNKAIQQGGLNDKSVFSEEQIGLLKLIKDHGRMAIGKWLSLLEEDEELDTNREIGKLFAGIGRSIFKNVPDDIIEEYGLINDVTFVPDDKIILAMFSGLESITLEENLVYYSSHKPAVKIDDKEYQIVWTSSAVKELRSLIPEKHDFDQNSMLFSFLIQCINYELESWDGCGDLITFWDTCSPNYKSGTYVLLLWDGPLVDDFYYYYRVGHCKYSIVGDYVRIEKFLRPGIPGTPEYKLLEDSEYKDEETKKTVISKSLANDCLFGQDDVQLKKIFHTHDIPQMRGSARAYKARSFNMPDIPHVDSLIKKKMLEMRINEKVEKSKKVNQKTT